MSAAALARAGRIWLVLAAAAIACLAFGLGSGSADLAFADALRLLVAPDGSAMSEVIQHLRLPRALAAFATGGLLAVSGLMMQALLRNPLADPYVLGLSSGASVGALAAMMLGLGAVAANLGAVAGAAASMALVFVFARGAFARDPGHRAEASPRLLLTGVVLASGWSALVTVLLVLAPDTHLRGMLFWLMGDLGGASLWMPAALALLACVAFLYPVARDLNAMLLGDDVAATLGVETAAVRQRVLFAASVATAIAVTTAGPVGFVGLVVPHLLRLAFGNDQRVLLPACALGGGILLLLADTVARTAFSPQQVPVGAVTAVLGVPTFMALLLGRRGRS